MFYNLPAPERTFLASIVFFSVILYRKPFIETQITMPYHENMH